jgi:cellulose biosynthesis protein BcsQ
VKTIAFFNNKGGIGSTTLLYNLACMIADRGQTVLAVDLGLLANLTSLFLDEHALEDFWPDTRHARTILGAVQPIIRGFGDAQTPHVEKIDERLSLIVGDPALTRLEDELSDAWLGCEAGKESAFNVMTAFYTTVQQAARDIDAEWVLVDIGPSLGALNRASLLVAERVIVPVDPDLISLQGLRNLGPALRTWRRSWDEVSAKSFATPVIRRAVMEPLGYVMMLSRMVHGRAPNADVQWIDRFPSAYRESVLDISEGSAPRAADDPFCLAILKQNRSLMSMALDARKPVFTLKPADGAIGAYAQAVRDAYTDFHRLAQVIAQRCGSELD